MAGYPNKNDSEDTETNKISGVPNFMLQKILDDELTGGTNSIYSEQRKVFNVVQTWIKDYVKYDGHNIIFNQSRYFFQAVEAQENLL